jgi:hypothetical protein
LPEATLRHLAKAPSPSWDYHPGSYLVYNPQRYDVILASTRLKHRQSLQPDGNYLKWFDYEIETM